MMYIDAYKYSHPDQYPEGTTNLEANWTPRGSRIPNCDFSVNFGLQAYIQKYIVDNMNVNFFGADPSKVLKKYAKRMKKFVGEKYINTTRIEELLKLGYVPLRFHALPEGTKVPIRVPMFLMEATHPKFAWLVNSIETNLSLSIWKPCTSATTAYLYRDLLNKWAEKTGGDPEFVNWQGHDFSMRGMSGLEDAQMSGAAHLLSFYGTDVVPALDFIEEYYDTDEDDVIAGSVIATEHSVMCAGGKETELDTYSRILDLYPEGIVSVVSDTYDLWSVITKILPKLKDRILARDGKLVIRPDSGVPEDIICGDSNSDNINARKGVIQLLWEIFGGTINSKGYKVLDSHIGAIYGDSITLVRAEDICRRLAASGFASTNVVLGIGSFTYEYVTRDTLGFAMKTTYAEINGADVPIFKSPITDIDKLKFSAMGRLACHSVDGKLTLINNATPEQRATSLYKPVWDSGNWIKRYTWNEVRSNLWSN